MHRFTAKDRIENINGELFRIVNAEWKDKNLDVLTESETGQKKCRNIFFSAYCGYMVDFPEYDDMELYGLEDWAEPNINIKTLGSYNVIPEADKNIIIEKYPEFKYVLKKWTGTTSDVFKCLQIWKQHKDIELLLAAGLEKIAFTKKFYTLTKNKQKEVLQFLRKNNFPNVSLQAVFNCLKHNITVKEFESYKAFNRKYSSKYGYQVYKYFMKQIALYGDDIAIRLTHEYRDHLSMCKTLHKTGDYWLYPARFSESHQKLIREWKNWKNAEELKIMKNKQKEYYKAVKKVIGTKKDINGFTIYVPDNVTDIQNQAESLHQCLVTADYISKVIKKQCVLVFIKKDGIPVATAEVKGHKLKGAKIGQFYANELDRNNCLPDDNVKLAMNEWLKSISA